MLTTTEIAVTITIWFLTISGAYFGLRAVVRRRKSRASEKREN